VDFNFTVAKKMDRNSMIPDNSLRINNYHIILSANIVEQFSKLQPELAATGRIMVQIGADPENEALQLVPTTNNEDEFTFRIQDSGIAQGNIPTTLKKMKMPRGSYYLIKDIELPHVYRLHEGWSHVPEEEERDPNEIRVGDHVTWRTYLKGSSLIAEGVVVELRENSFGGHKDTVVKPAAKIKITSKEYLLNSSRRHTIVSIDSLTLKETWI